MAVNVSAHAAAAGHAAAVPTPWMSGSPAAVPSCMLAVAYTTVIEAARMATQYGAVGSCGPSPASTRRVATRTVITRYNATPADHAAMAGCARMSAAHGTDRLQSRHTSPRR
jgi:hypothetical protein